MAIIKTPKLIYTPVIATSIMQFKSWRDSKIEELDKINQKYIVHQDALETRGEFFFYADSVNKVRGKYPVKDFVLVGSAMRVDKNVEILDYVLVLIKRDSR